MVEDSLNLPSGGGVIRHCVIEGDLMLQLNWNWKSQTHLVSLSARRIDEDINFLCNGLELIDLPHMRCVADEYVPGM